MTVRVKTLLLTVALSAAVLCSCNGNDTGESTTETTAVTDVKKGTSKTIKIVYFDYKENDLVKGGYVTVDEGYKTIGTSLIEADRDAAWQILSEYINVKKYPEEYAKSLTASIYSEYRNSYAAAGFSGSMKSYGITVDSCAEEAKSILADEMAVYAFVQSENITYTDEEYSAKASEMAERYGYTDVKIFKAAVAENAIETELYRDKVIEKIAEINKRIVAETTAPTETEVPAETIAVQ